MQYLSFPVVKYLSKWTKMHYLAVLYHIDTQMSTVLTYTDRLDNPAYNYTQKHTHFLSFSFKWLTALSYRLFL